VLPQNTYKAIKTPQKIDQECDIIWKAAKGEIPKSWVCNECGAHEYSMAVSESDIADLGCGRCGANEWHIEEELLK
tara:strand:- start:25 stop:252 length:228 start_codon:yes stop_codon:yes gene_type:complete